jgi:Ca-activated chloride channel family protein
MNANDVQPTRLEKAKEEIQKIIERFPSDKIGIIGFSSTASTLCPPTYDQSALNLFTQGLNTNLLGSTGSDLSSGLELPLKNEGKTLNSELKKVLVLITDGEDYGDKAIKAANELRKNNFQLLILGIGNTKGSKIPFNGTFKKDTSGNFVISKLEKSKLEDLADLADGYYFEVNDREVETESLLDRINLIEGMVSDVREVDASANKYLYFLIVALFFIIIDVLITVRTVKI